ncbi:MAG: sulfite oxidase heme-binding subunit YedZ [Bacteroidota bacterium]
MTGAKILKRIIKPIVFALSLSPIAYLLYAGLTGGLGADPIRDITQETGVWTLRYIAATLSITPLRKLTGWNPLSQLRRMLGLFAFFYVCLHFTTYIWLDQFFDWHSIVKDIGKRPFILVGFSSFVLLIPLAITSFKALMIKLGGKRWKWLHRLVYLTALGGVIHYYWLVKADTRRPIIYGIIIAMLLGFRIWDFVRRKYLQPLPIKHSVFDSM